MWAEPEGGGYPILWWQLSPWPELPRFSGGSGEPNDPFLISTAEQLNSIGHNPRLMTCHFKLVDDLDLTGFRFYPIGDDWRYRYSYAGVFDGNGHRISHLTTKGEGGEAVGMFCWLAGEVKNLGVADVNITGSGYHVGGLVGYSDDSGSVTRCYSTGAVRGWGCVAGLVGWNDGTVTQSYSASTVNGTGECCVVGGLVGENLGAVTQCYSTGAVSFSRASSVGGLVGSIGGQEGPNGSVTACFWDTQTSGLPISAGGTGKTTAQMRTAKTFLDAGWDFVDEAANGTEEIWWINEGKDYPRLWWERSKIRNSNLEIRNKFK
jgi:hypothetical protein